MRTLFILLFSIISLSAFSQIPASNITIYPLARHGYILTADSVGTFAGRGVFRTFRQVADLITPFLTIPSSGIQPSDTSSMLSHYIERGDTAAMLANYLRRGYGIDDVFGVGQALTANRTINLGSPYGLLFEDENGKDYFNVDPVNRSYFIGDKEGVFNGSYFNIDGITSKAYIKNTGAGLLFGINTDSPSEALDVVGNAIIEGTISASNLSGTNTGDQDLSGLLLKSDTSAMLSHYIERGDTSGMLTHYIERGDTAAMLSHYLNSIPGIDDVLAVGQALTTNRTINANSNVFRIIGTPNNIIELSDDGFINIGDRDVVGNGTTLTIDDVDQLIICSADVTVPDEAYDATAWNGSLEVPTKNAIRDKIETLGGGSYTDEQAQDAVGGMVNTSLTYTDGTPLLTIADRDNTDITTTSAGTVWNIDADAVGASEIAAGAVDASELASTAVTPGSYTNTNLTVDADGRITAASNGSGGSSPTTISPSQITSDQDNYAPTGIGKATYVRLSGDSDMQAITGIEDSTAGTLRKTLFNVGSNTIYFPMDHPDSDAAHRFTGHSGDYKLYPGKNADIWYDVTSTKWRFLTDESESGRTGIFYDWQPGSTTAGDNGILAFQAIGSGTIANTTGTTSLPIAVTMSTVSNAAWGYIIYLGKTAGQYSSFGSAHNYTECLVSIPVLSTGSETFTSELQITESPTSGSLEPNNTIGIRYSHGVNGGEWELFSQDNTAGEDVADSNIAVQAAVLYKLRIEIDKSKTEARGYINDVYIGKVETNLPNSVAIDSRIIHLKSVGTTARTLNIHGFKAGAIYN